jgi:hypothetical protein
MTMAYDVTPTFTEFPAAQNLWLGREIPVIERASDRMGGLSIIFAS